MYAYDRGYDDYIFGIDYNPYVRGTRSYFYWEEGWHDAYLDDLYQALWY